ncbi:hypothetical protein HDU92_002848 [Lobulomyces angularis]|nr:hypothetical protein HDU92_002848 [Lobulomyces angularis]
MKAQDSSSSTKPYTSQAIKTDSSTSNNGYDGTNIASYVPSNLVLYEDQLPIANFLNKGPYDEKKAKRLHMENIQNYDLNEYSVANSVLPEDIKLQRTMTGERIDNLKKADSSDGEKGVTIIVNEDLNADANKLNTLMGVYIPSCSNIMGVLVFVRLAWIVGVAGIGHALIIFGLSVLLTFLTALSMSAIATNGKVAAGGAYYMISRALGKEFGGSVGLLFCLANAVGSVMYILGVVEILTQYIAPQMSIGSMENNARVYGSALLVLLAGIVFVGIGIVSKAASLFSVAVVLALLGALVGLFASNRPGLVPGIVGFPGNFAENFSPGYNKPDQSDPSVTFFTLFGIFFPSVTGILSGASRSGNLRNPSKSIPIGTISAQVTTSVIYFMFIMLFGTVISGTLLRTKIPESGLLISSVAWPSPWVTLIGCVFASLGAALQCLVSAPRLVQAVAQDNIIPILQVFSKLSEKSSFFGILPAGEPRNAFFLIIVLAEAVILIGNLDAVAQIVTMLYLITYLFINVSTALLGFIKAPNWRPSWKFYHWTLSALASLMCVTYMFMISWIASLISITFMIGFYKYIEFWGSQVQWGDGVQALNMQIAQKNLYAVEVESRIANDDKKTPALNVKNWRPQILCFVELVDSPEGSVVRHPKILNFLKGLKKGGGLTMVSSILVGELNSLTQKSDAAAIASDVIYRACVAHNLQAFSSVSISPSLKYGIISAVQCCGVGVLKPNTICIGFLSADSCKNPQACERFIDIIRSISSLDKVLMIVKGVSNFPGYKEKQYGTIDVYWVCHDGGILTLFSHLLRKQSVWKNCKLRIFALAQMTDNSVAMKENLIQSLKQLRIDAICDVLELGNYNITEFAFERTVRLRQREALYKQMEPSIGNLLALPTAGSFFSLTAQEESRIKKENLHSRQLSAANSNASSKLMNRFKKVEDTEKGAEEDTDKEINLNKTLNSLEVPVAKSVEENINYISAKSSKDNLLKSATLERLLNKKDSTFSLRYGESINMDRQIQMMNTAVKINLLMKENSGKNSDCRLIFTNLPQPGKKREGREGLEEALAYVDYLNCLTEDLPRIILIKGTGTEVFNKKMFFVVCMFNFNT